jgi:prepilin-type N-terminal cleavage/methylation domain-containing protein
MIADRSDCRGQRGFTLIELLIVIGILGTLAAVLLPRLLETGEAAKEATTQAHMLQLETGIREFERKWGISPPDDFKPPSAEIKVDWKPDNGRNTGIESLVCFLSRSTQDGTDLTTLTFANTDGDDHGVSMPLLNRRSRDEVVDAWGTPLAYFGKFGFDKPQSVVPGADTDAVQVKCKRQADGSPIGARRFQLLSAGKDLQFGTDDDIVWPKS